jgi:hypothetical protein
MKQLTELSSLGVISVQHVTTFEVHRQRKDHTVQTLTVKVYDAGPDTPHGLRYSCTAESEEGHRAGGNSGASLEVVFAGLHWFDLDKVDPGRG